MDSNASGPVLLRHDTLVMQQITGSVSNDFDILDGSGEQVVGRVSTTGSGLSRFFAGSRSLDISDADGTPLLHVEDPADLGLDRFELSHPDGTPLAEVNSRFALFATHVSLTMADGTVLELNGDMLGLDFTIEMQEVVAATVARQWAGLSRASSATAATCSRSNPRCRRSCGGRSSEVASCWT